MKLEEEIHQKAFRNDWQKGMVNLLFTYGWVIRQIKDHLKPFGISVQQYNVLRILNGAYPKPLSTSIIAARMLDKASDASRIVDRMSQKGWVEKNTCESDKRLVDVKISEEGKALIAKLDTQNSVLDSILENLSLEEVNTLNTLLDKLRA